MDTPKQEAKRTAAIRRIIGALQGGRHISLYDSAEFEIAKMHTAICNIRSKIAAGQITGYVMKSRWEERDGIRYKSYWFEDETPGN